MSLWQGRFGELKVFGNGVDRLLEGRYHCMYTVRCHIRGFIQMLETVKVADNVRGLLCGNTQKTVLMSNGLVWGEVGIKCGTFQRDSLSPPLFVLAMIPLTRLLKKEDTGYKVGKD